MGRCTYCNDNLEKYDPIRLVEKDETTSFCNYACLYSYIEENEVMSGACCKL